MSLYEFMFTKSPTTSRTWFVDASNGRSLTGTEMKERTDALARGLESRLGLGSNYNSPLESHLEYGIRDVVGIVCPNSLDFGIVIWASHKLGCTVAPINARSTVAELQHQLTLTGVRTIFCHPETLESVLKAATHCRIDRGRVIVITMDDPSTPFSEKFQSLGLLSLEDLVEVGNADIFSGMHCTVNTTSPIAFLCFSSGTTGLPKAVIVPHSAIIAEIRQLKESAVPSSRVANGDRALGLIPFSHMFGLVTLVHLSPHLGIATVIFKSMPSFHDLLSSIVRLGISHLYLVPPLVNAFVKHEATARHDLTFLKTALVAAAPLGEDMETAFQGLGGKGFLVTQGFGMTECGGLITGLPMGSQPRPGSVGRLLSSVNAKIIDEQGIALGSGQRGQLCVRGPQICPGYLGNMAATQSAFDAQGFLLTGDIAEMTPDGYLYIVDRLKGMIKNKGYSVSPAELEAHLLTLDIVDDAGVVGRPDDRCGEVPVAFIMLSELGERQASCDTESVKSAILQSVREMKTDFKWLHDVHFVKSIPRLSSGKVIVHILKELATAMTVRELTI